MHSLMVCLLLSLSRLLCVFTVFFVSCCLVSGKNSFHLGGYEVICHFLAEKALLVGDISVVMLERVSQLFVFLKQVVFRAVMGTSGKSSWQTLSLVS